MNAEAIDLYPDLEAIGVIAAVSTGMPDDLYPGRVHDLGYVGPVGESPWRLGLMLRRIWEGANPATRRVLEGDAIVISYHVWQMMTGGVVSL